MVAVVSPVPVYPLLMRSSLGFPMLALVLTSVACGGSSPLPIGTTGGAGTHPASGSAGQGGSTSPSGVAGTTGASGSSAGPGVAGTVGTAGSVGTAGANGTAGVFGAAGVFGTTGGGGFVGPGVAGSVGGGGTFGGAGAGGSLGNAGATGFGGTCADNAATVDPYTCRCIPGAYVHNDACMCQQGMTDVCPSTGCTNKMLDPDNCGVCGTSCMAASTCNGGSCGPVPTLVLPTVAGCQGMTIAVTATAQYYTDALHNTVNQVGAAAPLASGEMGATWLAVNGTNLFWYDAGSKKIRMMPMAGGTASDVYTNTSATVGGAMPAIGGFLVTADGMSIYISLGATVIKKAVAASGTAVVVADEVLQGLPGALGLAGTTNIVYPTGINGDVDAPLLSAMPAICGMQDSMGNDIMTTCPRLARSQGELLTTFMAVVSGHAYWVDGTNLKGELIVTNSSSTGGVFDTIAMAQTSMILTAASNGTDTIYFGDADPGDPTHGFIERTSLAPNSTPILLARAQNSPQSMALDAARVYWATADCAIMSQSR
jgi:hypothetical protein